MMPCASRAMTARYAVAPQQKHELRTRLPLLLCVETGGVNTRCVCEGGVAVGTDEVCKRSAPPIEKLRGDDKLLYIKTPVL